MQLNLNVHFWVGFLVTVASAIAGGTVHLTNAIPPDWIPVVTAWSSIVATFGGAYLTIASQTGIAPANASASAAKKAAIALLAIGLAGALLSPGAANAQTAAKPKPVIHRRAPLPQDRPDPLTAFAAVQKAATSPANPKALTITQAQQNPVALLQTFTVNDLDAALADAQGQTPPDTTAANCYQALLPIVQSNVVNPLPAGPGAFQAIQKIRDAKALLANLQSPTGPLAALNTACAPLILDAQTTLLQLGITTGAVAATVSTGGLASPLNLLLPFKIP